MRSQYRQSSPQSQQYMRIALQTGIDPDSEQFRSVFGRGKSPLPKHPGDSQLMGVEAPYRPHKTLIRTAAKGQKVIPLAGPDLKRAGTHQSQETIDRPQTTPPSENVMRTRQLATHARLQAAAARNGISNPLEVKAYIARMRFAMNKFGIYSLHRSSSIADAIAQSKSPELRDVPMTTLTRSCSGELLEHMRGNLGTNSNTPFSSPR